MNTRHQVSFAVSVVMIGMLSAPTVKAQQMEIAETRMASASPAPAPSRVLKSASNKGRVWTNEDFPSRPAAAAEALVEAATGTDDADASPESLEPADPMVEQTRREVSEQMLQVAKDREKAYDGTIDLVKAQLETETSEFRKEVLKQILEDTVRLKEINKHMLEQFDSRQSDDHRPAL